MDRNNRLGKHFRSRTEVVLSLEYFGKFEVKLAVVVDEFCRCPKLTRLHAFACVGESMSCCMRS